MLPDEFRLYQLLQIGLTADEAEDGPAVRNDWLLAIHQAHQRVPKPTPQPPPGG
jgi:hypothetical protein